MEATRWTAANASPASLARPGRGTVVSESASEVTSSVTGTPTASTTATRTRRTAVGGLGRSCLLFEYSITDLSSLIPGRECRADEFTCGSGGKCLDMSMVCDGDEHCPDGSDERGCKECKNGAKMCVSTGKCIPKWKLCDGVVDCPDRSDELVSLLLSCFFLSLYVSFAMLRAVIAWHALGVTRHCVEGTSRCAF